MWVRTARLDGFLNDEIVSRSCFVMNNAHSMHFLQAVPCGDRKGEYLNG